MADAVYSLRTKTMEAAAKAGAGFTGSPQGSKKVGPATNVAPNRIMATSGALWHKPSTGFGYCASSKDNTEAFFVAKGTDGNLADILTDLNCVPTDTGYGNKTHDGFVQTFKGMEPSLATFMGSHKFNTLHCIGHSLGGALATLAANKYSQSKSLNVKLYTFGSPRVFYGNDVQLKGVDSYRVFHKSDPVPMVAPYPFRHYDAGIAVGSSATIFNPWAHMMESYKGFCEGVEYSALQVPTQPTPEGFIENSKGMLAAGGAWMLRALQHLVTYAFTVLGIAVVGTWAIAATAADVMLYIIERVKELGWWVRALLRSMALFINDGWESAKAKSNDTYYDSKRVMLYIIEKFLMKVRQAASSALNRMVPTVGANVENALRSMNLPLPSKFL
jgi:pimeloyl-ACP methyl ester carboxylesterase